MEAVITASCRPPCLCPSLTDVRPCHQLLFAPAPATTCTDGVGRPAADPLAPSPAGCEPSLASAQQSLARGMRWLCANLRQQAVRFAGDSALQLPRHPQSPAAEAAEAECTPVAKRQGLV